MAAVEGDQRALYRSGGISALALGASYLAITVLYSLTGLVPTDTGEAWLVYLQGKMAAWWGIVGLSALTDLLFFPVAAALYVALNAFGRNLVLAGAGLILLFAVLDLAVTQIGFASLIVLSGDYAAATTDAERSAVTAAASYPVSVFRSGLFAAYVIGIPALGILLLGFAMRPGRPFSRTTAYAGVTTGILGIITVIAGLAGALAGYLAGYLAIITAVLTLVWVLLVGWRLLRLATGPGE